MVDAAAPAFGLTVRPVQRRPIHQQRPPSPSGPEGIASPRASRRSLMLMPFLLLVLEHRLQLLHLLGQAGEAVLESFFRQGE